MQKWQFCVLKVAVLQCKSGSFAKRHSKGALTKAKLSHEAYAELTLDKGLKQPRHMLHFGICKHLIAGDAQFCGMYLLRDGQVQMAEP